MTILKEKGDGSFEKQFAKYAAAGVGPADVEGIYTKAHAAIRADPSFTKKAAKENPDRSHNKKRETKRNYLQRKNRVKQILAARAKAEAAE
jgi:large subunit ribosomal protein L5e